MDVKLIKASETDAALIWEMQKKSFDRLLEKYQDFETNPANEPLECIIRKLKEPFTYFYFIEADGKKVGAIRIVDKMTEEPKRISPLFVLPQFRNMGYAQKAILKAELIHGDSGWELATILQEQCNCYLYEKMGYRKTGKLKRINSLMTLVGYVK